MQDKLNILGKRIAELRSKKGLTQEQLAERVGYSTNHISKLELARTNPSFELLIKISSALNIELKDLFDFKDYITSDYIRNEMIKIINSSNDKQIKLLYKIYRSISL